MSFLDIRLELEAIEVALILQVRKVALLRSGDIVVLRRKAGSAHRPMIPTHDL